MVFQDPFASLDPRLTVGFSVAEPLLVHGIAKGDAAQQRVRWLLEHVGLAADTAQRYPHEFSGGQRQRIAIARALALQPEDDRRRRGGVGARRVDPGADRQPDARPAARVGLAYLFISHDMAVVERISHRVAVMYLGPDRRDRAAPRDLREPAAPLHAQAAGRGAGGRSGARRRKPELSSEEIPSPIRAVGDEPVVAPLAEVGPGALRRDACGSVWGI